MGTKEIKIKNKKISEDWPVFFVAEIGINHNGSIEVAKELIDLASFCKCDAVKFQKRTPDLCVPENQKNMYRDTPWGRLTYLEYKKRMEFNEQQYKVIDDYCKEKDIIWFASPWDLPSVDFLEGFKVPCYKIPSPILTNKKLLEKVRDTNKPVMLSTGMSTISEIDKAVSILDDVPLVIMHCNSSYPTENSELNLRVVETYKRRYPNHILGYSGHEKGYTASLVAAVLGARVIERHITLDRTMWGSDQSASLELSGLLRLTRDLSLLPLWLGNGEKRVYNSEIPIKEKLRTENTL
ncbi:MAG: N-acetylneuraminate synthase family protein [Promethearchaeota archaeon]